MMALAVLVVVGAAGPSLEDTVLVGSQGEIFAREGASWRARAGGIGAGVAAIWGTRRDDVWAIARTLPIYRHDGKQWLTVTGVRGRAAPVLGGSGSRLPAVAVGKRVYAFAKGKLVTLPETGAPVTALALTGEKDGLAITTSGLVRLSPAGWRPVKLAEPPVALCGSGVILGGGGGAFRGGKRIALGIMPRTCESGGGRTVAVGAGDELVEITAAGATPLPGLPGGETVATLVLYKKGELAITRAGGVFVREGDGWTVQTLEREPPAPHPPAPPAVVPH